MTGLTILTVMDAYQDLPDYIQFNDVGKTIALSAPSESSLDTCHKCKMYNLDADDKSQPFLHIVLLPHIALIPRSRMRIRSDSHAALCARTSSEL